MGSSMSLRAVKTIDSSNICEDEWHNPNDHLDILRFGIRDSGCARRLENGVLCDLDDLVRVSALVERCLKVERDCTLDTTRSHDLEVTQFLPTPVTKGCF
jgi:hypothetical protein